MTLHADHKGTEVLTHYRMVTDRLLEQNRPNESKVCDDADSDDDKIV